MQAMHSIKNISFLLAPLFILCLLSACHPNDSNSLTDGLEIPSDTISKPASLSRTELISKFDSEMSKYNDIRWTDAFTGKESAQSFRYKWFSNWATNDELINLVNSKNTNIKVYAFLALKNRKNINLKSIVLDHLHDSSSFTETYGCIGNFKRVNSYFFEESIGWFSKVEVLKFRNLISGLNSKLVN